MKVFNARGKVNFVDENNVVLGYDMGQSCCETADWFVADRPTNEIVERYGPPNLEGFVFDADYFQEVSCEDLSDLRDGGMVIFRLVNGDREQFLHLFNCHNGYYSHGFELTRVNPMRGGNL